MRLIALMSAAFVLFVSGPAFAQEWIEYISEKDLFSVNFPGRARGSRHHLSDRVPASPCRAASMSTRRG